MEMLLDSSMMVKGLEIYIELGVEDSRELRIQKMQVRDESDGSGTGTWEAGEGGRERTSEGSEQTRGA
jgi:hypothetical protein